MTLLYFLPVLVALAFVLAHLARGGTLGANAGARPVAVGLFAVAALAVLGLLVSYVLAS